MELHPVFLKVLGSTPGQDTYLGCGFVPQPGCVLEATGRPMFLSHVDVSLSL